MERNIPCSSAFEEELEVHLGVGQLVARTLELTNSWWKAQLRDCVLLCCFSYNF